MTITPRRAFRAAAAITLFGILISMLTPAHAQKRRGASAQAESVSAKNFRRDAEVARMLSEIDARNIERTIRMLVSFGTRNTLSEQDNPKRGIGAARDWIYNEFLKIRAASGGRLNVEKQAYEQAKTTRVPQPTIITNVVATLRGTEDASADRIYVVSGHYDSMCSSPTDATCDAPGA
ncbi:MAG: aminopeptidase, partial [Pyrinomonadaceae bacterium]|nr:aminopeptidase [Pyrinomonadaceae bacterium]